MLSPRYFARLDVQFEGVATDVLDLLAVVARKSGRHVILIFHRHAINGRVGLIRLENTMFQPHQLIDADVGQLGRRPGARPEPSWSDK